MPRLPFLFFPLVFMFLSFLSIPVQAQDYCSKAMSVTNDESLGHARFYAAYFYKIACECKKGVTTQDQAGKLKAYMEREKQDYNSMKPQGAPSLPAVPACRVKSGGAGGAGGSGGGTGGVMDPDKYQLIDSQTMGVLQNLSMSSDNERFNDMVKNLSENQAKLDMMRQFATSQEDIEFQNFIGSVAQGATIIGTLFGGKEEEQAQTPQYSSAAEMYQDEVFQGTYRLYNTMVKWGYLYRMKHGLEFYRAYLNDDNEAIDQSLDNYFAVLDSYDDRYKEYKERLIIQSINPQGSPQENINYYKSLPKEKQSLVASDRLFFLDLNNIMFGKEFAVDYDRNEFILDLEDERNRELGKYKADRSIKEATFYINFYLKKAELAQKNGEFYVPYVRTARQYLENYYASGYPSASQTNRHWPQYYPAQLFMKGMIRLGEYDRQYLFSVVDDFFAYKKTEDVAGMLERVIEDKIAQTGARPHKEIYIFDAMVTRYLEYRYLEQMELKFLQKEEDFQHYTQDLLDDTVRLLGHKNHKVAWKMRRQFDYNTSHEGEELIRMYRVMIDILLEDHQLAHKYRPGDISETLERVRHVYSWHIDKEGQLMDNVDLAFKHVPLQTYTSSDGQKARWTILLDTDYVTEGIKDRTGVWSYNSVGGNMNIDGYIHRWLFHWNQHSDGATDQDQINELFDEYSIQDVYGALYEYDRTHLEIPKYIIPRTQSLTDGDLSSLVTKSY